MSNINNSELIPPLLAILRDLMIEATNASAVPLETSILEQNSVYIDCRETKSNWQLLLGFHPSYITVKVTYRPSQTFLLSQCFVRGYPGRSGLNDLPYSHGNNNCLDSNALVGDCQ